MRIALMASEPWLVRHAAIWRSVIVGLADQPLNGLYLILPEHMVETMGSVAAQVIGYRDSQYWWWRRVNQLRLGPILQQSQIDVLVAMDAQLAWVSHRLADRADAGRLVGIWSRKDLRCVHLAESRTHYFALSRPLAEQARRKINPAERLVLIPPGLMDHPPKTPARNDLERSVTIAVILDPHEPLKHQAIFPAMQHFAQQVARVMYVMVCEPGDHEKVWQQLAKHDLHGHVTLAEDGVAMRRLALDADAVCLASAVGGISSWALQAMRAARPMIALHDPIVDYLHHEKTAMILKNPMPEHWLNYWKHMLEHPQRYQQLGESAREYLLEHHRASAMVQMMIDQVKQVATPAPLPFNG